MHQKTYELSFQSQWRYWLLWRPSQEYYTSNNQWSCFLNGVHPNDAPLSQIITLVQGSWDVLEPRQPHSTFADSMHVLMWLACVTCWVLSINSFRLYFRSVPFLYWNFEINLGSQLKSLEPKKLSNIWGGVVSFNLKWELPDNWNSFLSSGLFNSYFVNCWQWWRALDLGLLLLLSWCVMYRGEGNTVQSRHQGRLWTLRLQLITKW